MNLPVVHLDANAGAFVHPAAWAAWQQATSLPGAPDALHARGRAARAALREAETQIAQIIGAGPDTLRLLSGGTEADALALGCVLAPPQAGPTPAAFGPGSHLPHVVSTGVEHAAMTQTLAAWAHAGRLTYTLVPAARSGRVDPDAVLEAVTPQTRLVSMTWACNETGVVQPVSAVINACRARNILVHTDAVQAVGRVVVDVQACPVDLLSFSGHKMGAVGGIGALYVRPGTAVQALYADQRPMDVPGAMAWAAALKHVPTAAVWAGVAQARDALEAWAKDVFGAAIDVLGADVPRLPNTSCLRFVGCSGEALMMALDVAGFAVATGSACSSGAVEASPLLLGMGLSSEEAQQAVRLSYGPQPFAPADFAALKAALLRVQAALAGGRF